MESATNLIPLVQLQLKGCPEATVAYGLRRAFVRMCSETGCWRTSIVETVSGIEEIRAGVWRFELAALRDPAWLSRLVRVQVERLQADSTFSNKQELPEEAYSILRTNKLYLVFEPGCDVGNGDKVVLDAVLVPNEAGNVLVELPQSLVELTGEAVVHLAVYLLASMSRRPWTDLDQAAMAMLDYRRSKRVFLLNDLTGGSPRNTQSVVEGLVE